MKRATNLLPLVDYQRIFQVAHGIIREVGKDTSKSCVFFSIAGAHLLNTHYGIGARPIVGAAFYKLDASDRVLAIAYATQQFELSSREGFHCWVEADGWCLDFTSPLFPEMAKHSGYTGVRDRRMFQKPLSSMAEGLAALKSPGDFYLNSNMDLTRELLTKNIQRNDVKDLIGIAAHWYRKPPRKIESKMTIGNDLGRVMTLTLDAPQISGVW
ncbi:hypothetical protein WM09_12130 [Burkholderia ubonensis]|uniref:DUF2026 family protein n=1 Tax=Burkholderia ubonensis TaxID=101571 RepID=UPI00075D6DA0|nr:DUF2026 family protein [Burkholderia ubonensis]KWI89998.1 hypothetical protein WM09_12130 [Burkholderia ubonensis]